jgi:hypothetical protein
MALRIAVAERAHATTGLAFPVSFPLSFGAPSRAPVLSRLADAAVLRVTGEPAEIIDAEGPAIAGVEALLWEWGAFTPESMLTAWPGTRAAAVDLDNASRAQATWHPGEGYDVIVAGQAETDFDCSVSTIVRWLLFAREDEITADEGQMLEVLISDVRRLLEREPPTNGNLRDDIAQVQAAVDTIQAQLRAPRPVRRFIGWALAQISGLVVGYASGLASGATLPYLPELLRAFPHII